MGKAKRGRPRGDRPRYSSGQIKPDVAGITTTSLHRLRALGTNPLLETQVGRLWYLDELREIDAKTAFRIAEIYGRYDRALGRRRNAASPSYEAGRGRDAGLHESESQRSRAESAARHFGALQAEIKLCPRGVKAALEELCVEDRACPPGSLPAVKIALDMLAVPLGIRRMRRIERVRHDVKHSVQINPSPQVDHHAAIAAFGAQVAADLDGDQCAALYEHFRKVYECEKIEEARRERERFRAEKRRLDSPK